MKALENVSAIVSVRVAADALSQCGEATNLARSLEERSSKNKEFVEKVIEQHVRQTMANIRKDSPVLAELEASGKIKIVGGIYDLHTGKVTLLK